MKNFPEKYKNDIFAILFFLLFLPLFFYNLSGTSLVDFDEAWYAEISRNILVSRQPFLLSFNGLPYTDHPPLGFILIAISFLIFGINEFAARLPSALLGFLSVITLYFIGKNLFNKVVGITAALMLVSSVWFIFRARSGNLDSIFLFFYLFTFYAAIKACNNYRWIYVMAISFGFTLLGKSAIGLSLLIPITTLFITKGIKLKPGVIFRSTVLLVLFLTPFFVPNIKALGFSYINHVIQVGTRSGHLIKPNILEIGSSLTFKYLHFGIREWYYPSLIALVGSLIFIAKHKSILSLYIWVLILLIGFLTNAKTEIWHLLPLYPVLGLMTAFFLFKSFSFITKFLTRNKLIKILATVGLSIKIKPRSAVSLACIFLFLILALKQIFEFRHEINLFGENISGLAATAKVASYYPDKLYLDNDTFLPSAVFYSQKMVEHVQALSPPNNNLKGIVNTGSKPFLLLTEQYRLNIDQIDQARYEVLAQHRGHVLIKVLR